MAINKSILAWRTGQRKTEVVRERDMGIGVEDWGKILYKGRSFIFYASFNIRFRITVVIQLWKPKVPRTYYKDVIF